MKLLAQSEPTSPASVPSELGRLGAEVCPAQGSIPKFKSLSFSDCFLKAFYLGPQPSSPPGGRAGLGWVLGTHCGRTSSPSWPGCKRGPHSQQQRLGHLL